MTAFMFTPMIARLAKADFDWETADIRQMLVMSNTTADTDRDAATLSAITTLDEYNGSGYARVAFTTQVVNTDTANDRAELDGSDHTFGATVGAGTRQAVGRLIYEHVDGNPVNDRPIAFSDLGGFPFTGNGGSVSVTENAEGIIQIPGSGVAA